MSSTIQREFPLLKGKNIDALPEDLFIPPNALELILEEFSGPMDLLLYLINKKDIDILELDVASITEQYLQYIEIMEEFIKEYDKTVKLQHEWIDKNILPMLNKENKKNNEKHH